MARPQSDLLQGTLDLLILKSLALDELHGMGISRRIAQITNGTFEVKAGSLFPRSPSDGGSWLAPSRSAGILRKDLISRLMSHYRRRSPSHHFDKCWCFPGGWRQMHGQSAPVHGQAAPSWQDGADV
jgi:hypothetical protein